MERFKRKTRIFMGAFLSGIKFSLAIMFLIFSIVCAACAVLSILKTFSGETEWGTSVAFLGMGMLSGSLCYAFGETI